MAALFNLGLVPRVCIQNEGNAEERVGRVFKVAVTLKGAATGTKSLRVRQLPGSGNPPAALDSPPGRTTKN